MKKLAILTMALATAVVGAGCVGTSALRITSDPEGARVYANGKYAGVTPVDVPLNWGYYVLYSWCDTVRLRIEKEGYRPVEDKITRAVLGHRNRNGDYLPVSGFGYGRTYPYTFEMTPALRPSPSPGGKR